MSHLEDDPFASAAVLGALDADDRRSLARQSRRRRLEKGQILFTEGERSDFVAVLVSGHMNVVTYSGEGDEFIVNTVAPGETIGEIGVLSAGPRSATIQATVPCELLVLPGSAVIDLISTRPGLAIALLSRLSNIVRRVTGVAADLVFLDLRQRVAKYLLEHEESAARLARPSVTQAELAASVGASRQRVNACLRKFQDQGWIELARRGVRVLDRDALTDIVAL